MVKLSAARCREDAGLVLLERRLVCFDGDGDRPERHCGFKLGFGAADLCKTVDRSHVTFWFVSVSVACAIVHGTCGWVGVCVREGWEGVHYVSYNCWRSIVEPFGVLRCVALRGLRVRYTPSFILDWVLSFSTLSELNNAQW